MHAHTFFLYIIYIGQPEDRYLHISFISCIAIRLICFPDAICQHLLLADV